MERSVASANAATGMGWAGYLLSKAEQEEVHRAGIGTEKVPVTIWLMMQLSEALHLGASIGSR